MNKINYTFLVNYLNKAANAYYNSENPILTDEEYDLKIQQLKDFEAATGIISSNSPTQKVGAPVLPFLEKVPITPKPMLSLDKCHSDEEVAAFAGKHKMIAMVKLDGLSVRVKYNNGKLMSANTRGNGVEGTNITEHIKQFQNIPLTIPYQGEYIIDGEAIIKNADFEIINKNNEFKNPRNAAAGALNLLDTTLVKARRLSFLAWDIIEGSNFNFLSERLEEAKDYGFDIVPSFNGYVSQFDEINKMIWGFKDYFPCDGVVWKFDDVKYGESLGQTSHHFKNGIAWKPEVEIVESRLKHIDWTMGRTGVLTPVAIFDPVELDGSTIERASLHNYSIMRKILGSCAYVGEPLKIIKANMIIPQILEASPHHDYGYVIAHGGVPAHDTLEACPICGGDVWLVESDDGVENYICQNPNCEGKLINRLDHFCGKKGLDIKGLSKATLEKLINWGWIKEFHSIFELKCYKQEWISQSGFGEKSVDNILNAIEQVRTSNIPLEKYISAIGIPLIGLSQSKELAKYFKDFPEFIHAIEGNFDFSSIDGFGPERVSSILNFDYNESIYAAEALDHWPQSIKEDLNESLKDTNIVITGSLIKYKNRAALQADIEKHGGKVVSSVSAKTNYLINNDKNSTSSKNKRAQALNIPIISEEEFIKKFLL